MSRQILLLVAVSFLSVGCASKTPPPVVKPPKFPTPPAALMVAPPDQLQEIVDIDGDGRVTDRDALPILTDNDRTYHAVAGRLSCLQAWVAQQAQLSSQPAACHAPD